VESVAHWFGQEANDLAEARKADAAGCWSRAADRLGAMVLDLRAGRGGVNEGVDDWSSAVTSALFEPMRGDGGERDEAIDLASAMQRFAFGLSCLLDDCTEALVGTPAGPSVWEDVEASRQPIDRLFEASGQTMRRLLTTTDPRDDGLLGRFGPELAKVRRLVVATSRSAHE